MNKTMNKSIFRRLALPLFAAASFAGACQLKPGTVGGEFRMPAPLTPVCGAERQKILDGLKASYAKEGKKLPAYRYFEVYVVSQDGDWSKMVTLSGDMIWNAGYRTEGKQYVSKHFGYVSNTYTNKNGRRLQTFMFNEPRNTILWQRQYWVYMGM